LNYLKTFQSTSEDLYDKHDYRLVLKNKKKIIFENYYDLMEYWMTNPKENNLFVEVLDKKKKGFK
jgi:uncharacterized membrane protein